MGMARLTAGGVFYCSLAHLVDEIPPFASLGARRRVPGLDSGFRPVTFRTERLKVGQIEREIRPVAHGFDMVHFQMAARTTPDTAIPIALERLDAQHFPANC